MSDTDKTRPWGVKCFDDPTWLEEGHDHRDGACDLPTRPVKVANPFGDRGTRCQWVASRGFWSRRANGCGCARCAARDERRIVRRRARHVAKNETHDQQRALSAAATATGTVIDDLEDVDLFPAGWPTSFHDDVAWFASIRDDLGFGPDTLVVDLSEQYALSPLGTVEVTTTEVSVLHNDGRREMLACTRAHPNGPFVALDAAPQARR